jgi:hypothetical protein
MARMTPEQEAAYALDRGLSRAELEPPVQAEYDRLLADFPARRPGQPGPARSKWGLGAPARPARHARCTTCATAAVVL